MESKPEIPKLFVSQEVEQQLQSGLRLLHSRQIEKSKGEPKAGGLVWVVDRNGKFIGKAFANPGKPISAQVVSLHEKEIIDEGFFDKKILAANDFRKNALGLGDSYRVFYGEADGIPGLVIDRFANICSLQISCPGVEGFKQGIAQTLLKIDGVETVVERNDSRAREKLGLALQKGVLLGKKKTQTVINEGGVKFEVDVLRGHKTGFYLDQAQNRFGIEKYCRQGTQMLDVFCYTGGFGLHAASKGANVAMLDMKDAIAQAKRNARLNGVESKISYIEGKAFEETKKLLSKPGRFDLITVDPPAFVQRPGDLKKGKKAYHQINYNCMKLLKNNGILVTNSCSHFLSLDGFLKVLSDAASNAGKRASIIEKRFASADHLVSLYPGSEGAYLKCVFLRVEGK